MFEPSITTARFDLVPAAPRLVLALVESAEAFGAMWGVTAAPGLRDMYLSPDVSSAWLDSLRQATDVDPWRHGFFVVIRTSRLAIGGAGFKGPVDAGGVVEIAYGLVPGYRGRGLATEVAQGLMTFARSEPAVRRFRAHTLAGNAASHRVLEKSGFAYLGDIVDPEDGVVMRWERDASADELPLLFVYGTLRRDAEHPMHDLLASASEPLGTATMGGRMYHLGAYPGILPTLDGDIAVGEAYELNPERAAELLRTLDDYEGVAGPGRAPGEYLRRLVEIQLADGRRRSAWAWILTDASPPHPRIPSGDFTQPDAEP